MRRPGSPRLPRSGFTLGEVVISTAIVVMLAAATLPSLSGFLDAQRAQSAANTLAAVQLGIVNGTNAGFFHLVDSVGTTGNYPGFVHDLANPLVALVATDHNSCGTTQSGHTHRYTALDTTGWRNNGPFVTFQIPVVTGGAVAVSTPIGGILDSIKRDTISGTVYLSLMINKVLLDDATTLDGIVDNGDGASSGSIRWVADAVSGFEDVKYEIPISPTHC